MRLLPELVLFAASVLVVMLGLEVTLRATAGGAPSELERAFIAPPRPGPDGVVRLGAIVQPSEEPGRIYSLRPSLRVVLHNPLGGPSTIVHTNREGFRDRDHVVEKAAGVRRIVGIGDSLMFGWGMLPGDDYLSLLGRRLGSAPPGERWEVINLAVPGYNTAMEVATLRAVGLKYRPDVVVVGFFWNDLDLPNFILHVPNPLALDRSFLLDFVRGRLAASMLVRAPRRESGAGFEGDAARVPDAYRGMVGWEGIRRAFRELARLAAVEQFQVVLLVFEPDDVEDGPRATRKHGGVAAARREGFSVVDVGAAQANVMRRRSIAHYYGSILTLSATDPHPSTLSHRLAADALVAHVRGLRAPAPAAR